jgi:hypothetical protein
MKRILPLLMTLVLPAALTAADFEGKVAMQMNKAGDPAQPMTFSIGHGKSRIDIEHSGHAAAMIFDPAKQEMTILMPEQKMYMVQSLAKQMTAAEETVTGKSDDVSVQQTGEHEKVLGYDCTKLISKSKEGTTTMWVTDQLGTFMGLGSGGNPMGGMGGRRGGMRGGASAPASQPWEAALKGKDLFPLRVVTTGADGKESLRMEATSVQKESLPESTFTPPADYKNLSDMMRGMGMPGGMNIPGMGR